MCQDNFKPSFLLLFQQQRAERARRAYQMLQSSANNPLDGPCEFDEDRTFPLSNRTSADNPLRSPQLWGTPLTRTNSAPVNGRRTPQLMHQTSEENPLWRGSDGNCLQSALSGRKTSQMLQTSPDNPLCTGLGNGVPPSGPPPLPHAISPAAAAAATADSPQSQFPVSCLAARLPGSINFHA